MGESLHCPDPCPLTVALSFWINPSVRGPIVKSLISEGLIGTILARDAKNFRFRVNAALKMG